MTDTRQRLLEATAETLRKDGIAGVSARAVAARAGCNQALVFYHFGTMPELIQAATRAAVDENVDFYRDQFARIGSLAELLEAGRALHDRERETGNIAVMAQLMAGAQQDLLLAEAARYAMARWCEQIEAVVRRLMADNPLADVVDAAGLAQMISAVFIGLELYDGVDPVGSRAALDAVERLVVLVDVVDDLGPVAGRALKSRLRKASTAR
ncbi:TetR family transcriptional regulator [Nocardioides rubriscoriae]|uniref:TetR family transcriptional regulator n=1 Tax=Nocardioides rubriscoriae TaxID=642762 RepID=UPI0011E02BAA|nr:TetR family transcriptional regulator [Nocardioides rubriscoriae]